MAKTATVLDDTPVLDESAVRQISAHAGESAAILEIRLKALAVLSETPLPDRVRHLWRFTNSGKLLPGPIRVPIAPAAVDSPAGLAEDATGAVLAASGDSFEILVSPAARAAGVRLWPIAGDARACESLGTLVTDAAGYFEALNLAAFTAGVAVDIPPGVRLAEPLRVLLPAPRGAYLPRILVRVGSGAEVTILEEHSAGSSESRMVSVTEILAGPASHVTHVLFQHWEREVRGHLTMRSRVARDAKVTLVIASMGGELTKMDLGSVLDGPGAQSEIGGVVLGAGRQHMDHHTLHEHRAENTWSNIDFKVALTGRGRSAYTGLIRIEKEARGAEAYQENRNLLLSEGCRADTIPELEILTDDVQCTHGATVAPMDDEQVFYLESRGIPPKEARRLIVQGFLEAALSRLPERLRQEMESQVACSLGEFLDEGKTA
ncbi:MAG: Fe-S cluster assembly protein SufD [Acidobacteria bacterium]|nr:Fe-S cluster assembly protein SufD [Acidobacteriota bacterium]